jgi:hypothetical protein
MEAGLRATEAVASGTEAVASGMPGGGVKGELAAALLQLQQVTPSRSLARFLLTLVRTSD